MSLKHKTIMEYEKMIEHLNLYLLTTGEYVSKESFKATKQRIEDYKEFVTILKGL